MSTAVAVFDTSVAHWQQEMRLPWSQLKYRLVHANLAKHFGPGPGRVLDAGGGSGLDSIPLAAQGHHVDLVDYSSEMLAQAARAAAQGNATQRVALHHADVSQLATLFAPATFDLALCHNVLHYVEDVSALLGQLAACVKPGGLISVVSINRYSTPYQTAFLRNDLTTAFDQLDARQTKAKIFDATMTTYSAEEVTALLQAAGCRVEQDYGIRCLCDYWGDNEHKSDPAIFAQIERLEFALTDRHPYKLLARYFQIVARRGK